MRNFSERPWCIYQVKCAEDKNPGEWTCTAHMDDNRIFRCPKRDMAHAKSFPGRCEDAEPTKAPKGTLAVTEEEPRRKKI